MPLGAPSACQLHHQNPPFRTQSLGTGQHRSCCPQSHRADAGAGAGTVPLSRSLQHPCPSPLRWGRQRDPGRSWRQRSPRGEPSHRRDTADPRRSEEPPGTQHPARPCLQTPEPARPWGSAGKSGSECTFLFAAGPRARAAAGRGQPAAGGGGSRRGQPVPALLISLSSLLNHTPPPTACNALKDDRY